MARNFAIGDTVYVPTSRVPGLEDSGFVMCKRTVVDTDKRSIKVDLPGGAISDWIGNSACHKNVGILVLTIGDLETERNLLDPLTKSILQYCRMLVPDDQILSFKVRSLLELEKIWKTEQAAYSHIILIGHGSHDGFKTSNDGWCSAETIAAILSADEDNKKMILSLCCQSGHNSVAAIMSKINLCSQYIAPFRSVHGALASQFAQTFLAYHFVDGKSSGVAFRKATAATPGAANFRLWESGVMKAGPKR